MTVKRKKIYIIIFILIFSLGTYLYFDGMLLYQFQKAMLPPLKLIEYYAEKTFPEETELNSIEFHSTNKPYTEYISAVLTIPAHAIDDLFYEQDRNYDVRYSKWLPTDEQQNFLFYVRKYIVGRRLTYQIRTSIGFTVLKPENDYIKMYVGIGGLGCYRQY